MSRMPDCQLSAVVRNIYPRSSQTVKTDVLTLNMVQKHSAFLYTFIHPAFPGSIKITKQVCFGFTSPYSEMDISSVNSTQAGLSI